MFNTDSKIYIAGHTGLLGSALVKTLHTQGYNNLILKTHKELDLCDYSAVDIFFKQYKPEFIFLAAAKVGGIISNQNYPADYLHVNLKIQDNLFELANKYSVKHLIFYGSSCTYPKVCAQPMKEDYLLTGPLEMSSIGYASAKIAGIYASQAYNNQYNTKRFICVIPNSMYGPFDNFDSENSHVFAALIKKINTAKEENASSVTLWGSGKARREFIFSEDVASASIFLMKNAKKLDNSHYNLGSQIDYTIKELATHIAKVIGYKGIIKWDTSKPDGTMQKLLDSSKLSDLGWQSKTSFENGLKLTYQWYKEHKGTL